MKRSGPPKRKSPLPRSSRVPARQDAITGRKPIKRKARTLSESERVYGPAKRREWLTLGRCVGCKVQGTPDRPLHQHHTANGGMGRKADYTTLVSLCHQCHQYVHDHGQASYEKVANRDLRACAARTEREWVAKTEGNAKDM